MDDFIREGRKIYALVWKVGSETLVHVEHALDNYYKQNVDKHVAGKMKGTRRLVKEYGTPEIVYLEDNICSPLEAEYTQIVYTKLLTESADNVRAAQDGRIAELAADLPGNLEVIYENRVGKVDNLIR